MSLYSAMYSSVAGLTAQSSAMAAISDNITNVNTMGFKGSKVQFSSMVTQRVNNRSVAAGGVQPTVRSTLDVQGLLSPSASATDLAISGDGFFVVNEAPNPGLGDQWAYTRAGSFRVDDNGYLVNPGGWYLQGWPTLPDGTVGSYDNTGNIISVNQSVIDSGNLRPVNINLISASAAATNRMDVAINLPQGADVGDSFSSDALFFDSLGSSQDLGMVWTKTNTNTWDLEMVPPADAAVVTTLDSNGAVNFARGQLVFEGTFTNAVLGEMDGGSFDVTINGNTNTFVFDDGTNMGVSGAANWGAGGNTYTFGIGNASSFADIVDEVERVLNDSRVSTSGIRIYFDTDDTNGDIVIDNFVDTASSGLSRHMPTSGIAATTGGITVPQLDATDDTIVFSGDGSPQTINVSTLELRFANGATDMTGPDAIDFNLGTPGLSDGMTQYDGSFQPISVDHNGARFGSISGVSVAEDGTVVALFDNGESRAIYKLPVATFVNPNGLESRSGNAFIETNESGTYSLRTAGGAGAGTIESNSLESSTVDIGEEFTNMIITQRAYSAAAKIVTTADQMLDELIRLKR